MKVAAVLAALVAVGCGGAEGAPPAEPAAAKAPPDKDYCADCEADRRASGAPATRAPQPHSCNMCEALQACGSVCTRQDTQPCMDCVAQKLPKWAPEPGTQAPAGATEPTPHP